MSARRVLQLTVAGTLACGGFGAALVVGAAASSAHSHGCHGQHSCPSDHHSYIWVDGSGQAWDCARPGSDKLNGRENVNVTYDGLPYLCYAAAGSSPPPTTAPPPTAPSPTTATTSPPPATSPSSAPTPSAGAAAAPSAPAAGAARGCKSGWVAATMGGARRCLKAGQYCTRGYDIQYHRYGFHCHAARLTRR